MASSDEKRKMKKLLEAASSGNLRVLKEVANELDEGKGVVDKIKEIKDAKGHNAFHLAAYHGRTEICQYFVEDLGETALFPAVMGGREETASYLINHGANPVVSNELGYTPLHYAAKRGHEKLVKYLISSGVPVDVTFGHSVGGPIIIAALCGQTSTVKVLLEHHADVNSSTSTDYTPLFSSVFGGSLECTKLLIKAGADLNLKCPLAIAVHRGLTEIIKCLLEAGADPNVRNEYGWLPLEIAVAYGRQHIVEILFPLTSPVPEVHEWSVDGIYQYVKSNVFLEKYEVMLEKKVADVKVKGADSFRKKDYLAAISFYTKAIDIDSVIGSGDAALFSNRSLCWHRMREGDRALDDALMAKRLGPEWPKAYYRIGAAMMLLEEYEQASEAFMDALLLDPTNKEIEEAHRKAVDCLRRSHFGEESE
ncbi:hypothetical protein LUZ61_016366 [Rhynchospora tenuis]|uniref:Serine/threonine-protein kinase BSK1-like TPR repeats domain-containing protein n=1 Tax=Rhynchospora tenuis TaxID=198213 RepID=A0AAD5Z5D9_9POAL|nr:hypothetical protein LUZ61_016366 [Rhynchospora tenuis]